MDPSKSYLTAVLMISGLLATSTAPAEVVESKTTYESQGKTIEVERYEPKAPGQYPAILVLHGAGGMKIGGFAFRAFARKLAEEGYVAHVVHYFDRTGTDYADLKTITDNFAAWLITIGDGVTNVARQPNVHAEKIGLLGFSLGSYLSLSLATKDPRIVAIVEYFGGLPEALAREVKTMPPTLILHGETDPIVPVKEARALETLYKEKGFPYEIRLYPGQGHGFLGADGLDAARRAMTFFDTHVKSRAK